MEKKGIPPPQKKPPQISTKKTGHESRTGGGIHGFRKESIQVEYLRIVAFQMLIVPYGECSGKSLLAAQSKDTFKKIFAWDTVAFFST